MLIFSVQMRLRAALNTAEAHTFVGSLCELLDANSLVLAGGGSEQWRIVIGPGSPDLSVTEEHRQAVASWLQTRPEIIASHVGVIRDSSVSEKELFEDIWLQGTDEEL